jgi:hypothetical protein
LRIRSSWLPFTTVAKGEISEAQANEEIRRRVAEIDDQDDNLRISIMRDAAWIVISK